MGPRTAARIAKGLTASTSLVKTQDQQNDLDMKKLADKYVCVIN
jgi:hypothetical protein